MSDIYTPSESGRSSYAGEAIATNITIPPDGGWGWVIVVASFLSNLIVDGSMYTFGLYLNDIADSLDVLPTTVAIATSIMNVFYYSFGAITCALVNHYGFRVVGVLGGLIASSGYLISSLVPTIVPFLLSVGLVSGTGLGMIYVPSIVVVGFYFERWRSMATSIAVTGSSLGIVLIPLINEAFLQGCHWRTKFRMLSACLLAAGLLALLYRPLKPTRILKKGNEIIPINDVDSIDSSKASNGFFRTFIAKFHNKNYMTVAKYHNDVLTIDAISDSSVLDPSIPSVMVARESIMRPSDAHSTLSTLYEVKESAEFDPADASCCKRLRRQLRCHKLNKHPNRPMYRDDILYFGSLNMLAQYSKSLADASYISRATTATTPNIPISLEYHMSVSRVATERDLESRCVCCPESIVRVLATMLDVSLLKSPAFGLLIASGFFRSLGMFVPFIYSINRGEEIGIDQAEASFLLSALGISNGLGRIMSGMMTSIPGANPMLVASLNLLVCGVATMGSCLMYGLLMQYLYVSVYGMTIAAFGSLRPSMIVELVGLENLTNAFGLTLLVEGVGAFSGVPLAGQLMVASGTYQACFYFSGACLGVSGMCLIMVKRIALWELRKSERWMGSSV